MKTPVFSIITVVKNHKAFLKRTIESVARQSYKNIEFIVIDGGSEDGSLDLIKAEEGRISYWVSEPDHGMYDAMNKGIKASKGDYLWFINAGDQIFNDSTIEDLVQMTPELPDIFYGDTELVDGKGLALGLRSRLTPHALPDPLHWKDMRMGMAVCHQSFIVKKEIVPPYTLKFRYCSDIDWMTRCLKSSQTVLKSRAPLSKFSTGGFSKKNRRFSWLDRYLILQRHFGVLGNFKNHLGICLRAIRFQGKSL